MLPIQQGDEEDQMERWISFSRIQESGLMLLQAEMKAELESEDLAADLKFAGWRGREVLAQMFIEKL